MVQATSAPSERPYAPVVCYNHLMDKASLRRQMRMRLYALSDDEIRRKSASICEAVIAMTEWQSLDRVSCYQSQTRLREVDTTSLIEHILSSQPHIALDLVEPRSGTPLPSTQYDLIIVPMLGYDDSYNRLGRGGGWYDRFLSTQITAKSVGLAFNCQRLEQVPIEDFDVELGDIVAES